MIVVIVVAAVLFGAAALGAVYRIIKGPSALDRVIASDVLVATVMCALGADMAINRHTDTLPVLLGLAIFTVVGSVSIARFMATRDDT